MSIDHHTQAFRDAELLLSYYVNISNLKVLPHTRAVESCVCSWNCLHATLQKTAIIISAPNGLQDG